MDRVAVLYICTGRYSIFWSEFYQSAKKFLLTDCNVTFFVFTDNEKLRYRFNEDVHVINTPFCEFPKSSLLRFDFFLKQEKVLSEFDYCFFFNANFLFVTPITPNDIFPKCEENGLIGYLHFNFYDKENITFLYERNPSSSAFIPFGEGDFYYQGSLIGGASHSFLEMSKILSKNIHKDLEKGLIAIWWDESHLNKFLLNKKVKILHPGFGFPELGYEDLPFEKRIVSRNKSIRGGLNYLRGQDNSVFSKIKFIVKQWIH